MRIQHNIMAMSAYRNYNTNTSALSKNLEKLSSGYKINRAGDDAAGLAISEKMRAQITGLNAAQKNVKDGISLVKTAEGAMQEIQDMLNRMDYLATQSANGTYQDEVDREALQKEVNQLKSEINRIADSANFNGIKLLDGSLDTTTKETINATTFTDLQPSVSRTAVRDGVSSMDKYEDVQGARLQLHKDSTGDGKTSFEIDLSNFQLKGEDGQEFSVTMTLGQGTTTAPNPADTGATSKGDYDKPTTGDQKTGITVTAGKDGFVNGKDIAKAIVGDSGSTTMELTAKDGTKIEYKVTADGNSLKFEMTDNGYKAAAKAYDSDSTKPASDVFNGNFDVGFAATTTEKRTVEYADTTAGDAAIGDYTTDAAGNTTATGSFVDGTKYYKDGVEYTAKVDGAGKITLTGDATVDATVWGATDLSSSNIKMGTAAAGTQLADGFTGFMNATEFLDGSGFKFGDTSYVFAGTDKTLNAKYDANTKVVDIRDLFDEKSNSLKAAGLAADALSRLSEAAADNKMFSIQVSHDVDAGYARINFREKVDYNGDGKDGRADLTTVDGVKAQVQHFNGSQANVDVQEAKGTALQLQIGDTSDDFNQLKVSVGDMHTKALGIADLDIGTAEKASAAIQTIKDAINNVSSVRGDLGAYQNRLEHTANNLSVMAENIQDAESTIRDTDIAEEMMAYTKNNILVQSAQAMLAQANQVPQGVLQLLG